MKKLGFGFVGLLVLIAIAIGVLPEVINWNQYKPMIQEEVKKAIDRDLEIAGQLGLGR